MTFCSSVGPRFPGSGEARGGGQRPTKQNWRGGQRSDRWWGGGRGLLVKYQQRCGKTRIFDSSSWLLYTLLLGPDSETGMIPGHTYLGLALHTAPVIPHAALIWAHHSCGAESAAIGLCADM